MCVCQDRHINTSAHQHISTGFTLLELLVVIAIVAMMMGLSVGFLGGTFGMAVKRESGRLVGAIKFAYNEAAVKNLPYRLVFDLTEQEYWLETGSGSFAIASTPSGEEEKKEGDQKAPDTDGEAPAGESPPAFTAAETEIVKKVKLDDVKLKSVFVAHQEEIIENGRAALYFFPNGQTETAVIHLTNEDGTTTYSVIVSPLTGKSRIVPEYVEYEKINESD